MRRLVLLLTLVGPLVAHADSPAPMTVVGDVTATRSYWTTDGSRIVTEATIRPDDGGDDIVVSQLGGSAEGYGQRMFPGPELMVVGMSVSVAAHRDLDLAQRMHVVVDDVHITQLPAGFVRTGPTKAGNYLFWESGCVFVTPDAAGTNQVVGSNEFAAIHDAIEEWNTSIAGCSYMQLVEDEPVASEVGGRDSRNLIKFRDMTWCRPAVGNDPQRCYDHSAAGITTATFVDDASNSRDGAIVDADVELNGADFAIADNGQTTGLQSCLSEIRNTLTHELGHVFGLEHTCRAAGDPERTDGAGNPVALCSATSDPAIVEATMYPFQDCAETKKASLEGDDIQAICQIYPAASNPGSCDRAGVNPSGCCSSSPPAPSSLVLALGFGGFGLRRRRKTSRSG